MGSSEVVVVARALSDRAAIDDLLTTYADAIDAREWDRARAVFSSDATLDYTATGGVRGSADEVMAWIAGALVSFSMTQHLIVNRSISVDGDEATARASLLNPLVAADQEGRQQVLWVGAIYRDRLRRMDDGWRIVERIVEMTWSHPPLPMGR